MGSSLILVSYPASEAALAQSMRSRGGAACASHRRATGSALMLQAQIVCFLALSSRKAAFLRPSLLSSATLCADCSSNLSTIASISRGYMSESDSSPVLNMAGSLASASASSMAARTWSVRTGFGAILPLIVPLR